MLYKQVFTDEQRRALLNLAQYYAAFIDAERDMRRLAVGPVHWKTVSGRDYLYAVHDSRGNAKSLGPRSAETERIHAAWHAARDRRDGARTRLDEVGRMYRAHRLGTISAEAAAILREADIRQLLGDSLIVVGTNAMPAYEIEGQCRFGMGLDETMDFDMAWVGGLALASNSPRAPSQISPASTPVWEMLKAVDSTYTVNSERPFQARNAKAYEVEVLVAPSRAASLPNGDRPVPIPLPEQEWLLQGRLVDHVVCARNGSPARIVAPDPRWFALHKLWMSDQEKRNALKRPKDQKQGERMLNAVAELMPQYPLGDEFRAALPAELMPYFDQWQQGHDPATARPPSPSW